MRTRTATRAGGASHCTRTAGKAWSNRRTSTVSSASFTRGSQGSSRVAGELVNLSRACALSCLMLGSPYPPGALEALAACARYLCGPAFTSDLAARVRARIPSGLTRLNIELSPNDDPHPIGLHDDASMSQLAQSFRYSQLSRTDFFSSLSWRMKRPFVSSFPLASFLLGPLDVWKEQIMIRIASWTRFFATAKNES